MQQFLVDTARGLAIGAPAISLLAFMLFRSVTAFAGEQLRQEMGGGLRNHTDASK